MLCGRGDQGREGGKRGVTVPTVYTSFPKFSFACVQMFLTRALMPLHKPKCVGMYHQQLGYCVTQVGLATRQS